MTCKHYADLYGRCVDCGDSWELRQWLTTKRPLNWPEMGSSAKDLWEARMRQQAAARQAMRRSWERGCR